MPARKGGKDFSVAVDGLEQLSRLPGFIDSGQRELLGKAASGIAAEVAKKAPGGAHGRAGRDVQAATLSSTRAVIRSKGFPGAAILERGGAIRPKKKGGALKLANGHFVRGSVFIRGRGYWRKGLRTRSKVVRQAFHEAFNDLEKHGGAP